MSYDMHAHQQAERAQCLRLANAGRGWHEYAKDKAKRLVKEDPSLHGDLQQAVEEAIKESSHEL